MTKIKLSNTIVLSLAACIYLNADDVDLGSISVESSTVNVTKASRTETSNVAYIDEQTIKEISPKHINEILQTIPGITSDIRTGEVVEIHLRGVGQQEFMWEDTGVAVVIDGVPLMQNGGKIRLNMSDIKSVKVIKGGASYLYGDTALAGAVIITTNKAINKDEYSIAAETGSHNYKNYDMSMLKGTEDYALHLNANYRTTDGYWTDSQLWNKSASGKFNYYLNDTSDITLGVDKTKKYEQSNRASVTGTSEAESNPKGSGNTSYQKDNYVDLNKYYLNYSKDFENNSNLMVNIYKYQDLYDYKDSPQDTTGDNEEDTYTNQTDEDLIQQGIKTEYKKQSDKFAYMLGLEIGDRDYDEQDTRLADYNTTSRGTTSYYYAGEIDDTKDDQDKKAIYGEFKYGMTPKLSTTFNIRHDRQDETYSKNSHSYDGSSWSDTMTTKDAKFDENSYRIGVAYDINDNSTLFSSVSTGFRTPTVTQLYAGDITGTSRGSTYTNNLNIKTQTTTNYEIGTKGRTAKALTYEASVFQIDNKNIIGKKDGTYYSGSSVYYDNVGDTRTRGLELSLKSDSSKKVSFNLSYTYLKSKYTKHNPFIVSLENYDVTYDIVGNEIPRNSNHIIDLYTTFKATEQLRFISEIYGKSSYYADETNLVKMPGYAVLNLQTRYNTKISGNNIELFAKVNNVFDKQYYRTVFLYKDNNADDALTSEDASITVDPGREFYAGVKYTF